MSEFLQRLQDRLEGSKKALRQSAMAHSKSSSSPADSQASQKPIHGTLGMSLGWLTPLSISRSLSYALMLACAISITFWLMKIAQIPGAPTQSANSITKGMTLYSNQETSSAYALFGSKPLATENIYLRGVVITSKNPDGTPDGFAIFEIDGKPTNAISVGESIGKGLSLQSIGDEKATLIYQGKKLEFTLSKPSNAKGSNKK